MGGMFLMIIITVLICGGVPALAFSYMKRKTNNASDSEKARANRKVLVLTTVILGTFFNCFLFPAYNFTDCSTHGWRGHSFFIMVAACFQLGVLLAGTFPYQKGAVMKTACAVLGIDCIHIFAGMGCRYLLEFGEVSNTYNFTTSNVIVHVLVIHVLCIASWGFAVRENIKINR